MYFAIKLLLTFMATLLNASESSSKIPKIHLKYDYVVSGHFAQYLLIFLYN